MTVEESYETKGALSEDDAQEYMRVIRMAWDIHVDREGLRHGLWKQYSCRDQAVQIRTKIDRILNALDLLAGDMTGEKRAATIYNLTEECLDIINYSVFSVRIANGRI